MSRMKAITQKQKILLLVIEKIGKLNVKSKTYLEKILFLLKMEGNLGDEIKFYSFYPYKYGPFSSVSYEDWNKLENQGLVAQKWNVTEKGKSMIVDVEKRVGSNVNSVITRFDSVDKIRKYVYKNYVEYTVKSEAVPAMQQEVSPGIFTIGYEGRDIDAFLDILIKNQIDVVIDIRYNPFSMSFNFMQNRLKKKLSGVDIEYSHIQSLGVEGSLRKSLNLEEDYKLLFDNYRKRIRENNSKELSIIIAMGRKTRIALLCFEKDKDMCHRGIVAKEIEEHGMKVAHL